MPCLFRQGLQSDRTWTGYVEIVQAHGQGLNQHGDAKKIGVMTCLQL